MMKKESGATDQFTNAKRLVSLFLGFPLKTLCLGYLVLFFSPQSHAFCVQTFNAYGAFYSSDTAQRTREFSDQLARDNCEVIHLQEVFDRNRVNMYSEIGKDLQTTHKLIPTGLTTKSALMSAVRGEVISTTFQRFQKQTMMGMRKGFSVTRARFAGIPSEFYLVNLHLHHSSKDARISQLNEVIAWRKKHPELPMILMGDFNANPGSSELQLITQTLKLTDAVVAAQGGYSPNFCTYCADNPRSWDGFMKPGGAQNHVYDYIFIAVPERSQISITIKSVEVNLKGRPGFTWSDHYGVIAQLDIRKRRR